eukprot:583466-Rhodomonas_salina.1
MEKFRTTNANAIGRNGEVSVGLGAGIAELIPLMIGTRDAVQVICLLPARELRQCVSDTSFVAIRCGRTRRST